MYLTTSLIQAGTPVLLASTTTFLYLELQLYHH